MPELDLTFPERKILVAIARGDSPTQVAKHQRLDAKTLQWITASIYFKLGVNSRPAAVAQSFLRGYLVLRDVPLKPARKNIPLTVSERRYLVDLATDKLSVNASKTILHSLFVKMGATGGRADAVAQACAKGVLKRKDIPATVSGRYYGKLRTISPAEQIALSLRRDGLSPQESSRIIGISHVQVSIKLNAVRKKLSASSIDEAVIIAERLGQLIDIELDAAS